MVDLITQKILIFVRQRRERLLKLRAQHPIIESSCDEQFVEEPIFDPDLPSTSNYHQQHFVHKHLHLPQIEEDIEQRVYLKKKKF